MKRPVSPSNNRKIVPLLAVAQGFYLSAMSVDLTITALAGASLAPSPAWSTLPMAMIAVGSVLAAPVVSRLIAAVGVRTTFIAGAVLAVLGGVLSCLAMVKGIFSLLCVGTLVVGVYQAVANYYRYIAADAEPGREAVNVARVLSAGVVAALAGPVLATVASDLLRTRYAGSYLAVSALGVCAALTLAYLPDRPHRSAVGVERGSTGGEKQDSLGASLFRRPRFVVGALLSFVGCFSMAVVMAGAPLELEHELHVGPGARMVAMQLHMAGMYLPMFLLPFLAKRLKLSAQAFIGILVGLAGSAVGLLETSSAVATTLLLLGVAWAWTYATGSALLTSSYAAAERRIARGVGELFPVVGLALGSLLAGPLIHGMGWRFVVCACAVAYVVIGSSSLAMKHRLE